MTGKQVTGLLAGTEDDLRRFWDMAHAFQEDGDRSPLVLMSWEGGRRVTTVRPLLLRMVARAAGLVFSPCEPGCSHPVDAAAPSATQDARQAALLGSGVPSWTNFTLANLENERLRLNLNAIIRERDAAQAGVEELCAASLRMLDERNAARDALAAARNAPVSATPPSELGALRCEVEVLREQVVTLASEREEAHAEAERRRVEVTGLCRTISELRSTRAEEVVHAEAKLRAARDGNRVLEGEISRLKQNRDKWEAEAKKWMAEANRLSDVLRLIAKAQTQSAPEKPAEKPALLCCFLDFGKRCSIPPRWVIKPSGDGAVHACDAHVSTLLPEGDICEVYQLSGSAKA